MDQALNQALAEPTYDAALASMTKSINIINAMCPVSMEVFTAYTAEITIFYQEKNVPKLPNVTINTNGGPAVGIHSPGNQVIQTQNNNNEKKE